MIKTRLESFERYATLEGVRALRERATQALATTGLAPICVNQAVLAIAELATNLVEHSAPKPSRIRVAVYRELGSWTVELDDDGGPIPPEVLAGLARETVQEPAAFLSADPLDRSGQAPDLDSMIDQLADRGRGLKLVFNMFPRARYRAGDAPGAFNRWLLPLGRELASVVVIEDDRAQLEVIKTYLAAHWSVRGFTDSAAALAAVQEQPPDLILADIHLPGINGLDLRRRLVAEPSTELVPFIFMTESTEAAVRAEANRLGIDDFLQKPVRRATLLAAVERTLNRSRSLKARLGARIDAAITAALQPRLPERLGDWRVVLRSRAAEAGGGDFVSYSASDGQATLVLVDVMGHGVAAKFFAHAHAGYIGGLLHSRRGVWEPGELLASVSERLLDDELAQYGMLTCVAAQLAPSGWVALASAGHPAPLLIGDGKVTQVEVGGVLPGLMPSADYATLSLHLEPGQRLALFTDGLFEAVGTADSRHMLEERLLACLRDGAGEDLDVLGDRVFEVVDELAGGLVRDDLSLILLEPCAG